MISITRKQFEAIQNAKDYGVILLHCVDFNQYIITGKKHHWTESRRDELGIWKSYKVHIFLYHDEQAEHIVNSLNAMSMNICPNLA